MEMGKAVLELNAKPYEPSDTALKERVISETRKRMRNNQKKTMTWRLAILAFILIVWQFGSGRFLDDFFVSSPSRIAKAVYFQIFEKGLLFHVQVTLLETLAGYLIGAAVAILLAVLIGISEQYYRIVEPFIIAVNGIPRIAIAPLFIMWFGVGYTPKVIIAALMVLFIVFMNTISGIRAVNHNFVNISLLMGASRFQLIRKVILPSAMPYILTSLKIVVPMAMTGAIVGEFISSQRGLGFFISRSTAMLDITSAFAGILVLMVVLLLMNAVVSLLEKRFTRWQSREHTPMDM